MVAFLSSDRVSLRIRRDQTRRRRGVTCLEVDLERSVACGRDGATSEGQPCSFTDLDSVVR